MSAVREPKRVWGRGRKILIVFLPKESDPSHLERLREQTQGVLIPIYGGSFFSVPFALSLTALHLRLLVHKSHLLFLMRRYHG